MIIGVEHIGLSDDDAEPSLASLGYRMRFRETDLPNSETKRRFLRHYGPLHDIAYYEPTDGSPALEVIAHRTAHMRSDSPLPTVAIDRSIDGGSPAGPLLADALKAGLGVERAQVLVGTLPATDIAVVAAPTGKGPTVSAYVVAVNDVLAASTFWIDGLGLSVESYESARRWVWLRLAPPVPRWRIRVLLCAGQREHATRYLDDVGFTNIAFLTSNLDVDRARLLRHAGADFGEPFEITVHGRMLRVSVGRSPDGSIIELIQIKSRLRVTPR